MSYSDIGYPNYYGLCFISDVEREKYKSDLKNKERPKFSRPEGDENGSTLCGEQKIQ
jgi:hypothetical protein